MGAGLAVLLAGPLGAAYLPRVGPPAIRLEPWRVRHPRPPPLARPAPEPATNPTAAAPEASAPTPARPSEGAAPALTVAGRTTNATEANGAGAGEVLQASSYPRGGGQPAPDAADSSGSPAEDGVPAAPVLGWPRFGEASGQATLTPQMLVPFFRLEKDGPPKREAGVLVPLEFTPPRPRKPSASKATVKTPE